MKIKTGIIAIILIILAGFTTSYSAIDQAYVERILKENRDFIEFIDYGVTNFSPDSKNDLFTIYQKHFNAEIAFLQGEYKRSFDNVYDSQKDMVTLFEKMLVDFYLEDSKNILDNIAPEIIRSKDPIARQYLTLGYRDRTLARTYYIVGEASHPKLYSYKIFKYVDAINMARRAKRYGFIAIYTSQTPAGKMKIYNQMFKTETETGALFFKRFVDKNEQDYIKEMNKTEEELEKEYNAGGTSTQTETAGEVKKTDGTEAKEAAFEGRVSRSVRFRKEQRVARYLLNGEFDKAEPIIRSYIDNYNFKLITATLRTLADKGEHAGEGEPVAARQDYAKLIQHHNDNYIILNSKSLLGSMVGDVKVIDDVKKQDKGKAESDKKEPAADNINKIETEKKPVEETKDATIKNPQ